MTRVAKRLRAVFQSEFRRNAAWYTGLTAFQRVVAMVQTILIARALGITEYGVYGLLFGTIGLVASTAGLQMGLTATVFVARYKSVEQSKTAAVISIVGRFGWIVAVVVFAVVAPFATEISHHLLESSRYGFAVLLGALFVGASIVSGIQDGVAEGFEIFGPLAQLKVATSVLVLATILPMAAWLGLDGVLLTILGGTVLKYAILHGLIRRARARAAIPHAGMGVSFPSLVSGFALPSMLVSFGVGAVTWLGMFLLSRQHAGFDGVAIVNTGLQWRGPVLLLASSIGTVAVPAFSRLHAAGDAHQSARLRRKLSLFNFAVAASIGLVVSVGSGIILSFYGKDFAVGRLAFSLIVLSTIPMVVANVYMQQLVGAARMWRQMWLQCPFMLVMCVGFVVLVPKYQALGYAISLAVGAAVFLLHVLAVDSLRSTQQPKAHP